MPESLLIELAGIIVLGAAAQWIAWRVGLPSILLLLVFGIVTGPVMKWIRPADLFGDLLFPVVSISVALILYEGGLSLKLSEFRKVGAVVRNLVTLGALATGLITAGAAHLVLGLDWGLSALLGAILVVTGPTVIGPLLRQIRPTGAVGPILKWEGIVIDPIGALLAVLIFEIVSGEAHGAAGHVVTGVLYTIVVGGGIGVAAGLLLMVMIERYWVADHLQNAVSLMLVVVAFAAANHVQDESGLLAVTVMGFVLANQRRADIENIIEFKENLRVLLISALFIILAARLELDQIRAVAGRGLLFVLILVVVARPLCVFVSTWRSSLTWAQRCFLGWMAPRGIVAAAVASVFAIRLQEIFRDKQARLLANGEPIPSWLQAGITGAEQLVPVTFIVIIASVALYGLTATLVARRLGVAESNPQGILFAGAHAWVREVAGLLQREGFRVLLVDSNRDNANAARMAGLPIRGGSILSERTLEDLDFGGIGRLFAVTPNNWVNVLAVQHFDGIFGRAGCYRLSPGPTADRDERKAHGPKNRTLFGDTITHGQLEGRVAGGFKAKATRISEEFNLDDYREEHGNSAIPLFVIDDRRRLAIVTAGSDLQPGPGQTLVSLVRADAKSP